ncbi:MAG: aldo/keto reductase [Verrucomicrobiia bacterium]
MLTRTLPHSDLVVSALCFGCMRLVGPKEAGTGEKEVRARAFRVLEAALEAGYTFFDHADIYGRTECEAVFGEFLEANPGLRERLVIATKCGIRFADDPEPGSVHRWDFSHEHIVRSCEGSLARLKVDRIDLYQLHRPDYLANPVEIACAFQELRDAGKVRYFGVSNFRPSLVAAVQAALDFPLVSNQVEISLLHRGPLTDGTLDQCLERKMAPLAWSPVARGALGEREVSAEDELMAGLQRGLDAVGRTMGWERSEVALAWLLAHPARIIPIVGTTNPARIARSVRALEGALGREDWYRLLALAEGKKLP